MKMPRRRAVRWTIDDDGEEPIEEAEEELKTYDIYPIMKRLESINNIWDKMEQFDKFSTHILRNQITQSESGTITIKWGLLQIPQEYTVDIDKVYIIDIDGGVHIYAANTDYYYSGTAVDGKAIYIMIPSDIADTVYTISMLSENQSDPIPYCNLFAKATINGQPVMYSGFFKYNSDVYIVNDSDCVNLIETILSLEDTEKRNNYLLTILAYPINKVKIKRFYNSLTATAETTNTVDPIIQLGEVLKEATDYVANISTSTEPTETTEATEATEATETNKPISIREDTIQNILSQITTNNESQ